MDPYHSITPPPDLVRQLQDLGNLDAIERAYQAGADAELEGCCEWLKIKGFHPEVYRELRDARHPNPERSAEVALNLLDGISDRLDAAHENGIRRALERLRELESKNT